MQALDIREFTALCNLIDEFGPKKAMLSRHGNGSDEQICAGALQPKQFRILRIARGKLKVTVLVEHSAFKFGQVNRSLYEVKPTNA